MGDRPGGWSKVWLRTFVYRDALQLHGHPAPAFVHQAWRCHGARPGPGLSRSLLNTDGLVSLDSLRNRDLGVRLGRSGRLRHRVTTSVRHSACLGLCHHLPRRAGGALFAKQRIPLHGGAGHYANRDDRQLLRSRAHFFKTKLRWSHARICSQSAYCHESGDALHRHRHHRGNRDAAQSLPAFINCADAQV